MSKHVSKKRRRNARLSGTAEIIEFHSSKFEAERVLPPITALNPDAGRLPRCAAIKAPRSWCWGRRAPARLDRCHPRGGPLPEQARLEDHPHATQRAVRPFARVLSGLPGRQVCALGRAGRRRHQGSDREGRLRDRAQARRHRDGAVRGHARPILERRHSSCSTRPRTRRPPRSRPSHPRGRGFLGGHQRRRGPMRSQRGVSGLGTVLHLIKIAIRSARPRHRVRPRGYRSLGPLCDVGARVRRGGHL